MIYDILPVNNYQGNNSTTTFDFDFYIESSEQLKVYHFDENNVKNLLIEGVDYSINEFKNENGSYITFPLQGSTYGTLATNEKISLELSLPISQDTQYNNSSLLNLKALEYSLDYLTRLIQIYARKIQLCVKVEECSENTPEQLIDSINQHSLNVAGYANSVQNALNSITEMKTSIDNTYNVISGYSEKFDSIDTLSEHCDDIDEAILSKADSDLENLTNGLANTICTTPATTVSSATSAMPAVIVENYISGYSWYRVWSDGWCEQGGRTVNPLQSSFSVSLLKNYTNLNYSIFIVISGSNATVVTANVMSRTTSSFNVESKYLAYNNRDLEWFACGYLAN